MKADFVKYFGVMLGVAWAAFGVLMIAGGVTGTGPCRLGCQFSGVMLTILGQANYNRMFGAFWVLCGLAFIVFILRISEKGAKKGR